MDKIKDLILKLFKLENISLNLTGYLEAKIELFKLEIRTDVAKAVSRAVSLMFLGLIGFLFLLFLSLGLAFLLNSYFESQYSGFFIVGLTYGFVFLMLLLNRKSLSANIEEQILKSQKNNN